MTWQLGAVVLYGRNGGMRTIPFKTGQVNIITGKSYTGKSSIIQILDYCLGRTELRVSWKIRSALAWVGVKLVLEDREVFVGREVPDRSAKTSTQAMFLTGPHVDIPSALDIRETTSIDTVTDELSRILGMSPNRSENGKGYSRDSYAVTVRHTAWYLFQDQDTLPSRERLFYRQGESWVSQSIVDTLPYFLGAIREDRLALEAQLNECRRRLRQLKRQLQEAERIKGEGYHRLRALAEEAAQVGLLETVADDPNRVLEQLQSLLSWQPAQESRLPTDRLRQLQDEYQALTAESNTFLQKARAVSDFARELHGYAQEVESQAQRLEVIDLFPSPPDVVRCPLCEQDVEGEMPKVAQMRHALQSLHSDLTAVRRDSPSLRKHIDDLHRKKVTIDLLREEKQAAIKALLAEREASQRLRDLNERKSRVIGRISIYLESYMEVDEESSLRTASTKLEREIEKLERLLDTEERDRRMDIAVNLIGHTTTRLGAQLDFEHKGKVLRFDPKRLTVHIDLGLISEALYETGSAANYVSIHIATLLALHEFFLSEKRPVPSFLVFDQPSQAYYEPDPDEPLEWRLKKSEDRLAVEKIYSLLFDVAKELGGRLQIIVLDHADFKDDKRFQGAVVEKFRGQNALVPIEWMPQDEPPDGAP